MAKSTAYATTAAHEHATQLTSAGMDRRGVKSSSRCGYRRGEVRSGSGDALVADPALSAPPDAPAAGMDAEAEAETRAVPREGARARIRDPAANIILKVLDVEPPRARASAAPTGNAPRAAAVLPCAVTCTRTGAAASPLEEANEVVGARSMV